MNAKHTPGPWAWRGNPLLGAVLASAHGEILDYAAYEGMWFSRLDDVEDEANARLIAAAPDSHSANIRTVQAFNEAFGINETWTDERIYDELPSSALALAYFAARDAIAKATGEPE